MRLTRRLLTAVLVAVLTGAFAAGAASAHGPCDDINGDGSPSGMEFGQFHISSHTPHGVALDAHNPGTHQGFSLCLGVH